MDNAFSPTPEITLVNCFHLPFDNAVAAARTCYSSRGIISAEEVAALDAESEEERQRRLKRRNTLAADIFKAGHHTVFQHAQVQFAIANISRQFAWTFLHSHPFYNSEQVSQRYVAVKPGSYVVPPLSSDRREVYEAAIACQFNAYTRLNELLTPLVADDFYRRFPARRKDPSRWAKDIGKKCMEIARYVLPVATLTYMYHTVSIITLLRYWRLCELYDTPTEQRLAVQSMVDALRAVAPEYDVVLEDPIPVDETVEHELFTAVTSRHGAAFRDEFDRRMNGRVSLLVDHGINNEDVLADAVREVIGLTRQDLSDDGAITWVLNPAQNHYLGESLNLTSHSKLCRAMVHPKYTFKKRLSHTADSQDQRHRMTPASRPCLTTQLPEEPDYITPEIVRQDAAVQRVYDEVMARTWDAIGELQRRGASVEAAAYLLPNAVTIRFTESADLMSLWHKHAMRLCYNAQEEIWRASLDEAEQIRAVEPRIGRYLLPPCGHRRLAGKTPICPEGGRYCGVPVWKLDLSEYERLI